jgi:hypothetical protein
VLPLSVGQESLWTIYRLAPGSAAYNDGEAVVFRPSPDRAALRGALRDLAARHDQLRSVFTDASGTPGREVRDPDLIELETLDLPGPGSPDPRPELRAAAIGLAAQPLAISDRGPLRAVLVRRGDAAALVLVCHHIAVDATSHWLIWRDLLELYRARVTGEPPALPPLRSDYGAFVAAEQALLGSAQGRELAAWWRGQCAGARPATFPADLPRPAEPRYRGASVRRRLDAPLTRCVRGAAAARGITPFALVLGAFQALLGRYSPDADLLIGCPATLRRSRATRDLVGMLVNTVPLRFSAHPALTFGEAAMAASAGLAAALPRARYPHALMDGGNDGRGPGGRPPALRVGITSVSYRGSPLLDLAMTGGWADCAGHQIAVLGLPRLEGQSDLTVEISQADQDLAVTFRYDTDLFTETAATALLERFERFIEAAADDPAALVAQIPLTTGADEVGQLLAFGEG